MGEDTNVIAIKIASSIGVQITKQDLNRSHRVGDSAKFHPTQRPRPIIVRFKGYYTKQEIMKRRRNL